MNFWRFASDMYAVEVTSADTQRFLRNVNLKGIPVFAIRQNSELTVSFLIRRTDYQNMQMLSRKWGASVKLSGKNGIGVIISTVLQRPILLGGILVMLLLGLYLPGKILFVRVEGNETVPERQIIWAAEEYGVGFWSSRRQIRNEEVKNGLLQQIPQLQWAGVNTYGCTAVISVREKEETENSEAAMGFGNVVASSDGIVDLVSVTRGNALCVPGSAVKKGQILISGYTDCGICIRATGAAGEVYAKTGHHLRVSMPAEHTKRTGSSWMKRKVSLIIGKKRINLWKDSGIWDTGCGRMYEEYYVRLPGDFVLPVCLCVESYTFYDSIPLESVQTEVHSALTEFAENYLTNQMVSGSVLQKSERIRYADGVWYLDGRYLCREMIGRMHWEQIGETYGKSS